MTSSSKEVLGLLNQTALLRTASSLAHGTECRFVGDPIVRPGVTILVILFPNGNTRWAARIPHDQDFPFVDFCVRPLEFLAKNHPGVPAPRVHSYFDVDTGGTNPVGVAYMLLDWIEGSQMQPWSIDDPPPSKRMKVLDQLAEIIVELLLSNQIDENVLYYGVPDGTPAYTAVSTTVWLTESIDRALRRNIRQQHHTLAIDNLIQRSFIIRRRNYVAPEYDHSSWAVMHLDLHNANMIIDEDYNIKGIIDWDFTFAQPLQKCAVFPKLLENVPGGAAPHLSEPFCYPDLAYDKAYFLSILAKKEKKKTGENSISKLIETSTERNFFEVSHHVAKVHEEYAARFCERSLENIRAALRQCDEFVADNNEFKDNTILDGIRKQLIRLLQIESDNSIVGSTTPY